MHFLKALPQNFNSECWVSIWIFKSDLFHKKQIHFHLNKKKNKTKQPNLSQGQIDMVLVAQLNQNWASVTNYNIVLPFFFFAIFSVNRTK